MSTTQPSARHIRRLVAGGVFAIALATSISPASASSTKGSCMGYDASRGGVYGQLIQSTQHSKYFGQNVKSYAQVSAPKCGGS